MLTLTPSGPREIVDGNRAVAITNEWLAQIQENPNATVHTIVLTNKSYSPEAAQVLADFFTSTQHITPCIAHQITALDMSDIIAGQVTENGLTVLQTLAQAFIDASSLETINLSDNAMGPRGIPCCEALFSETRPLKKLSLCNNGLSLEAMQLIAEWIVTRGRAPHLQLLHFFNNMSGDEGCKAFQYLIQNCSSDTLFDLRFASTRASVVGSRFIVDGLLDFVQRSHDGKVPIMKRLDLTDNRFHSGNGEILAQVLQSMPLLEYINLSECDIGDDGLTLIATSLQNHKHITFLDLSGNGITSEGVSVSGPFIQLLRKIAPTLQVLNLHDNELTSKGVANISKVLSRDSCSLRELRLGCTECGSKGADALVQHATSLLTNLQCLDMNGNFLTSDSVDKLTETFGELLLELDDNLDDSDFEDASLEEEEEEEEKQKVDEDEDGLAQLSQAFSQVKV